MKLTRAQETLLKILLSMRQRDENMREDDIIGVMLTVQTTPQIEALFDFIKEKEEKHELTKDNLIKKAIEINQTMN